ncbi:MAG: hypothetical protein ACXVNM_08545 [Bacteroidia bacterium]
MARKKKKRSNCRPSFHISEAGHLLATEGSSEAGSVLSSEGKRQKKRRMKRGCLHGLGEVFSLTPKQKRNLPKALQEAILEHHRRKGRKIVD